MFKARKSASRGPDELKWVFFGTSRSEITVICDPWPYNNPSTPSGEVSCPLRTKSEVLNPSRRGLRSEKVPKSAISRHSGTPKKNVFITAFRIYPRSLQYEYLRLPHGSDVPRCQDRPFPRRFTNFWGCPRVILQRIFTPGPITTLPQPPGRYPTHPGPILTSQLLLEGDLGPETCQNRLFRAILGPPRKTYSLVLSESTLDPYKMST